MSLPRSPQRTRRLWLGAACLSLAALTFPTWLDHFAASEPYVLPVADLFEREEPGRVLPGTVDDGIRRRREESPAAHAEPARRRAAPAADTTESLAPPLPLPRTFDPNGPFGR